MRLAVRVTPGERRRLVQRAAECGLSLSDYLRAAALGAVPHRRRRQHWRDLVAVLTRLSQQLGRLAHCAGADTSAHRLEQVLRRIDRAVREVIDR